MPYPAGNLLHSREIREGMMALVAHKVQAMELWGTALALRVDPAEISETPKVRIVEKQMMQFVTIVDNPVR